MAIETPYSKIHALIIDDMAVQQTTLRGQLAMLGISRVDQAVTAEDAIRHLRSGKHGLVLCDFNLNHKTDGQQLFEHLRENELLPADCLFFMVTAENAYNSVASASEHKPDAYLLKPITASDVEERLKAAMERRKAFLAVNMALTKKDLPAALAACETLLAAKDRWFIQALQQKGQLLLQLGRPEDAKAVYQSALSQRPQLIWAQLGLARALKAAGLFEEAKQVATEIVQSQDGERNVAAYDVLAEALEAQGDPQAAQWFLRDAAMIVPSATAGRLGLSQRRFAGRARCAEQGGQGHQRVDGGIASGHACPGSSARRCRTPGGEPGVAGPASIEAEREHCPARVRGAGDPGSGFGPVWRPGRRLASRGTCSRESAWCQGRLCNRGTGQGRTGHGP